VNQDPPLVVWKTIRPAQHYLFLFGGMFLAHVLLFPSTQQVLAVWGSPACATRGPARSDGLYFFLRHEKKLVRWKPRVEYFLQVSGKFPDNNSTVSLD
jgi:hypothetical protein